MTSRLSTPVLGGQSEEYGNYLPPHHFQLAVGMRGGASPFHWQGLHRRRDIASGVRNFQNIVDLIARYQVTRQTFMTVGLPVVFSNRRFLYGDVPTVPIAGENVPLVTDRPQWFTPANGLGDMTLTLNRWLLPLDKYPGGNVAVGFGLQLPTGSYNRHASFPEGVSAPVDISIQPGAGGVGLLAAIEYFKQVKKVTFFGNGAYLSQPRNATPTAVSGVIRQPEASIRNYLNNTGRGAAVTNSIPDAYVGQIGVAFPIAPPIEFRNLPAVLYTTLGARIEGTPPRDLIGGYAGFRRPGFELFAVPGMGLAWGRHNVLVTVPTRSVVNAMNAPSTPRIEDATFPNAVILATYNYTY